MAVALLLVVIAFLALMVTGYNDRIPGLHPSSSSSVDVAGDRTSTTYLFVASGTILNTTGGVVCPACPFAVATSSSFAYNLTFSDPFNRSLEVRTLSATPPFHLEALSPSIPLSVDPGLSVAVQLTLVAPPNGGTAIIPLEVLAYVG